MAIKINKPWLSIFIGLAALSTILLGTTYAAVQQNYRQNANDPQIQIAEDAATALSDGATPASLLPSTQIDIARSLAPFIVVYDTDGTPVVTSGTLNGIAPSIPAGVFNYTRQHGEDRFTWQPQKGVRDAVVVASYKSKDSNGFVMAGRSLREVEQRESGLSIMVGLAWFAGIFLLAVI